MNTKKNTKKEPINTINYYFLLQFRNIVKFKKNGTNRDRTCDLAVNSRSL